MMTILSKQEKEKIIERLDEQFGIKKIDFLLVLSGKDKIRGYSGSLSREELLNLAREINIETIGLYLFKIHDEGIRLTIDACNLFKEQIKKNIIELDNKQAEEWLKGHDLEILGEEFGFKILKYKEDFVGCGKLSNNRLTNFVPKERRIKN